MYEVANGVQELKKVASDMVLDQAPAIKWSRLRGNNRGLALVKPRGLLKGVGQL
jgi:hypothetical protein